MADPVDDDEILYRRFTTQQADEEGKPTSFAFLLRKDEEDGLSLFSATHQTEAQCLAGHEGFGLATITAQVARELGCVVTRDEDDPAHVLLKLPGGTSAQRRLSKGLALKATCIRRPTN